MATRATWKCCWDTGVSAPNPDGAPKLYRDDDINKNSTLPLKLVVIFLLATRETLQPSTQSDIAGKMDSR